VNARVRIMSFGWVLVWILLCCQITMVNRSRRMCFLKGKGFVEKKTHGPVWMWEWGAWTWGGWWCESCYIVRYTIRNRSHRICFFCIAILWHNGKNLKSDLDDTGTSSTFKIIRSAVGKCGGPGDVVFYPVINKCYYETINRVLKIKPISECRWVERLKTSDILGSEGSSVVTCSVPAIMPVSPVAVLWRETKTHMMFRGRNYKVPLKRHGSKWRIRNFQESS
jgi:hypothetical protein